MNISDRVDKLDLSGIRKVFDLGLELENPINFSIGQPDFAVPDNVLQSADDAMRSGLNSYTPTQGRADLIAAIEADAKKRNLQFEDTIITSGVSGGLFLAFSTLLNPGDEVILPDPYFLMYKQLSRFLDASPKYVSTYPKLKLTAEILEPHLNEKTKLLLFNSPGNPTGVGLTLSEMEDLCTLLNKYPNCTVISDEIYRLFHYENKFTSLSSLMNNVITLDGFSKSHSLTGWRVGWAHGPKEILQQMAKLQQFTYVCAPSFAQKACIEAVKTDMSEYKNAYAKKSKLVYELLSPKFEIEPSSGTFYSFPKVPEQYGSDQVFIEAALKKNVLIIPGNIFSEQNTHFRISFACSDEKIKEGCELLLDLA